MTSATDIATGITLNANGSGVDSFQITASASPLATPVRRIRCEGAGNLTVKTAGGGSTTRTMYFKDGETRNVVCTHVTAITGPTFVEGMP